MAQDGWKDPATDAGFALNVILFVILLILIAPAISSSFTTNGRLDRLTKTALILAIVTELVYQLITIVQTALLLSGNDLKDSFYVSYIISDAFGRLSDITLLALSAGLVLGRLALASNNQGKSRLYRVVKVISIAVLALYTALSIVCFGIDTTSYVQDITSNYTTAIDNALTVEYRIGLTLSIIWLIYIIFLFLVTALTMRNRPDPLVTWMLVLLVLAFLWVYQLIAAIQIGYNTLVFVRDLQFNDYQTFNNIHTAYAVIAPIMIAGILICAVLLGTRRFGSNADGGVSAYGAPVPAYDGSHGHEYESGLQGYSDGPTASPEVKGDHRQMAELQHPVAELHGHYGAHEMA